MPVTDDSSANFLKQTKTVENILSTFVTVILSVFPIYDSVTKLINK